MIIENLPCISVPSAEVNFYRSGWSSFVVPVSPTPEPNSVNNSINNDNKRKIVKQHNLFGQVSTHNTATKSQINNNKSGHVARSQPRLTAFFKPIAMNITNTNRQGTVDTVKTNTKAKSNPSNVCISNPDNFANGFRNNSAKTTTVVKDFSTHRQHSKNEIIIGYKIQDLPVNKNGTLKYALCKGLDLSCFLNSNLDHVSNSFSNIINGLVRRWVSNGCPKNKCNKMSKVMIKTMTSTLKFVKNNNSILFAEYLAKIGIYPNFVVNAVHFGKHVTKSTNNTKLLNQLRNVLAKENIELLKEKSRNLLLDLRFLHKKLNFITCEHKIEFYRILFKLRMFVAITQVHKHMFKCNNIVCNMTHACVPKVMNLENNNNNKTENCKINHYPYNVNSYVKQCIIPYNSVDNFQIESGSEFSDTNIMRKTEIPETVKDLKYWNKYLSERSSSYSLPILDDTEDIQNKTLSQIGHCFYASKWGDYIRDKEHNNDETVRIRLPFEKSHVSLPPDTDLEKEKAMNRTKVELYELITKASKSKDTIEKKKEWIELKDFVEDNDMIIIGSDKTKRNILTTALDYYEIGNQFIKNNKDYAPTTKQVLRNTEKEANILARKLAKTINIPKSELGKLTASNSVGAQMFFLIKDHKDPDENGKFKVRPVASVHRTPVNKLDFIGQLILKQVLRKVKTNLFNCEQNLEQLDIINESEHQNLMILSLDVVNLYPSIPIRKGIKIVMESIKKHWDGLETYGLDIQIIEEILTFVSLNYIVEFDGDLYLQLEGVPMGARFAPPFAIIYMESVENIALNNLLKIEIDPLWYTRYMDDTFAAIDNTSQYTNEEVANLVLDTFNKVDDKIKFTMELPSKEKGLPFLDTSIYVRNNKIMYSWYMKEIHSGNLMNANSHAPSKTKRNFVINSFTRILDRCNNKPDEKASLQKMYKLLLKNGYNHNMISGGLNMARKKKKKTPEERAAFANKLAGTDILKLTFLDDNTSKLAQKICNKNGLNISVVNEKFTKMNRLNPNYNKIVKCHCDLCKNLNKGFNCKSKKVVYQYECLECQKCYVGKTVNPIKKRHYQHTRGVALNMIYESALAEHEIKEHPLRSHDISNYKLSILQRGFNNVDTSLREGELIAKMKPELNRKHESRTFNI